MEGIRGGIQDSLARMKEAKTLDRNLLIYEYRLRGMSLNEIARPFRITKARVWQIIRLPYLEEIYKIMREEKSDGK